jgi:SAM-dependent methyltransferase
MIGALMKQLHRPVYRARLEELRRRVVPFLEPADRVLDVGCGYGELGKILAEAADVRLEGLERAPRPDALVPVTAYDGGRIPFPDHSFDVVILADVLHHEEEPERLLAECIRVARRLLVIKDHKADTRFQHLRVSFMDWAANAPYAVPCLYRYNSGAAWRAQLRRLGHPVLLELDAIDLYPRGVNLVFGRRLQYMAVIDVRPPAPAPASAGETVGAAS